MQTLPMLLPQCCAGHGQMVIRPTSLQTSEQKFCGTWYDCQECHGSFLFQSHELKAQLATQVSRQQRLI